MLELIAYKDKQIIGLQLRIGEMEEIQEKYGFENDKFIKQKNREIEELKKHLEAKK